MNRCSSAHTNYGGGPCSCGYYHSQSTTTTTPFSMLFSNHHDQPFDYSHPSSSSVDCTLSLGTPSTRLSNDVNSVKPVRSSNSYMPNFCWDILQSKHHHSPSSPSGYKSTRNVSGHGNSDPLVARRCANCDTTSTPLWRNGPRGPKSLCNACGIRYKKEERRASAAATTSSSSTQNGGMMEWAHHSQSSGQKMACLNQGSFGFMEDDSRDFLSWRLNVTDRPSLVHDFTR